MDCPVVSLPPVPGALTATEINHVSCAEPPATPLRSEQGADLNFGFARNLELAKHPIKGMNLFV